MKSAYALTKTAEVVTFIFEHPTLIVISFLGIAGVIGLISAFFSDTGTYVPMNQQDPNWKPKTEEPLEPKTSVTNGKSEIDRGLIGEQNVIRAIRQARDDFKVLSGVYIPVSDENYTEIDAIAIHRTGIFVIESKNYRGVIVGDEKQKMWNQAFIEEKREFYNPIMQNRGHINALKRFLNDKGLNGSFYSIIVFGNDCNIDLITVQSKGILITKQENLKSQLGAMVSFLENSLSDSDVEQIYSLIVPQTEVSEEVKQKHLAYASSRKENAG